MSERPRHCLLSVPDADWLTCSIRFVVNNDDITLEYITLFKLQSFCLYKNIFSSLSFLSSFCAILTLLWSNIIHRVLYYKIMTQDALGFLEVDSCRLTYTDYMKYSRIFFSLFDPIVDFKVYFSI